MWFTSCLLTYHYQLLCWSADDSLLPTNISLCLALIDVLGRFGAYLWTEFLKEVRLFDLKLSVCLTLYRENNGSLYFRLKKKKKKSISKELLLTGYKILLLVYGYPKTKAIFSTFQYIYDRYSTRFSCIIKFIRTSWFQKQIFLYFQKNQHNECVVRF